MFLPAYSSWSTWKIAHTEGYTLLVKSHNVHFSLHQNPIPYNHSGKRRVEKLHFQGILRAALSLGQMSSPSGEETAPATVPAYQPVGLQLCCSVPVSYTHLDVYKRQVHA